MLTSLGWFVCAVHPESRFLLRMIKFSGRPTRFLSCCTDMKGMVPLGFHRFSMQPTTSSHISLISNPRVLFEASRQLQTTTKRYDLPFQEPDEKLKKAEDAVKKEHKEEKPTGLFAKLKYYFKRYWYIAIPVHLVNCAIWFISLYIAVKSGLDVVALLKKCHLPDYFISKVKSIPPNAGVAVVALLLYKIATPLRYASSLLLIQLSFPILRRLGIMTAKEVKYRMRLKYTNKMKKINRRYQQKFSRMGSNGSKRRHSNGGSKKS